MKQKQKYDVNISLLFIFGISFLIWGIYLAMTGFINRQGLKHMTVISENTSDYNLSNIKKGDYINLTKEQKKTYLTTRISICQVV